MLRFEGEKIAITFGGVFLGSFGHKLNNFNQVRKYNLFRKVEVQSLKGEGKMVRKSKGSIKDERPNKFEKRNG